MTAPRPNRLRNAAFAALAISVVGGFEGLRLHAYPDPATHGAPYTICYGHTGHVLPIEKDSLAECKAKLLADMDREDLAVERCIHVPMSPSREVAMLDLAHNIGSGGACKSLIVRDLNAGNDRAACDAFLQYDHAANREVLPGLVSRREEDRRYCLE